MIAINNRQNKFGQVILSKNLRKMMKKKMKDLETGPKLILIKINNKKQ